jgi:hypothetical protein
MGFVFALVTEDGANAQRNRSQQPANQLHAHILVDTEHESTHDSDSSFPDFPLRRVVTIRARSW